MRPVLLRLARVLLALILAVVVVGLWHREELSDLWSRQLLLRSAPIPAPTVTNAPSGSDAPTSGQTRTEPLSKPAKNL
ncbi:hypothetical protein [Pseudodonghicola flavimaris]|uniref:Uncharacterized protein n=1 Tax=Pseudodonghicola flavimaris TaxID=3050036 RepID=A0ABT7F361_9RHOB|nr:hypothetical protein [Pseudodonghicola flavimaris]MDK3019051.1 hypothetical protein [Pseudodonghicola flavimaris]